MDETDIETIFGYLNFLIRKQRGNTKSGDFMTIGGRQYKRVSADQAGWL